MTPAQLSVVFFLQVAAILVTCRVIGALTQRWLSQPQVVGEMIAGVVLGPSLFGALAPQLQAALFPADSKPLLYVIAQFGVGLYMFLVGLGFDRSEFKANARGAALVSAAGMAAPFAGAALLVPWMLGLGGLFAAQVTRLEASLFLGAAIAITAFPMLARIIHERGLSQSSLGTLSLSAGAIGDAGAWAVIALVLASFGGEARLAVELDPEEADYQYLAGVICLRLGRLEEAKAAFAEAVRLRPAHAEAKHNLALLEDLDRRYGAEHAGTGAR